MMLDKIMDVLHYSLVVKETADIAKAIDQDVHATKRMLSILKHKGKVDRLNAHGTLVWWIPPAAYERCVIDG